MVVKIQTPLATNMETPLALVYNKSRDFETHCEIFPEMKKAMKGRPKAFFKIKLKGTIMHILQEVPDQGW